MRKITSDQNVAIGLQGNREHTPVFRASAGIEGSVHSAAGIEPRDARKSDAVDLGKLTACQIFADDSFTETAAPAPRRSRLTDTVRETLHFFSQGKTIPEIAHLRGLKDRTIFSHLEEGILAGEAIDVNSLVSAQARRDITAAFATYGFGNLGGVVESLAGKYSYGECRVVRAALQAANTGRP